jgi:hypothetical protein
MMVSADTDFEAVILNMYYKIQMKTKTMRKEVEVSKWNF